MMIATRIRGMRLVHTALLAFTSTFLFWLWLGLLVSLSSEFAGLRWTRYVSYSGVVLTAFLLEFVRSRIRGTDLLNLDHRAVLGLAFRQTLTVLGTMLLFLVATKDQAISRTFLFSFVLVLYGVLFVLNLTLPAILAKFLFHRGRHERTLLLGQAEDCRRVIQWCQNKTRYGIQLVGLLSHGRGPAVAGLPILGSPAELEEVVREHRITQVVSSSFSESFSRFSQLAERCDRLGVRLLTASDMSAQLERPVSVFQESGMLFVSPREEPLECPLNRIVKRVLDIALALPVVLLILPFLSLLVFVLHRLQSPGPLLFRQRRAGIGSGSFMIFKFRTMHVNLGDEAVQAKRGDVRVFRAGRWLRKLSLDEVPQFINVLKGEMSIVGPRPHLEEHDRLFAKVTNSYHVRGLVKPGITGLAQVRGHRGEAVSDTDIIKRVESDVYYLEHWSIAMEGKIILKTAWQMVAPPRTAY